MEVLEILKSSMDDLYPEDLAFFEAELDTGDYPLPYIDQCKELIAEIRSQRKQATRGATQDLIPPGMLVKPESLIPGATSREKTPQEKLAEMTQELAQMRTAINYKTRFKQFLAAHPEIDEAFLDRHIALFQQSELASILMVMPLSEGFLDKYFSSLDADKIARYQQFSEKFFIRHYAQMDAETVLTKGKNEWRKKESRSSQLDVFLRLKGVRI